jgi:hypothetical protein
MTFLAHGSNETAKGLWHLGGLVFAGGAALYNLCAFAQRRQSHLVINAMVYCALTAWEVEKTRHHFHDEPHG